MTAPVLSVSAFVLAVAALHGAVLGGLLLWSGRGPAWSRRCLGALAVVLAVLLGDMALRFSVSPWPGPSVHAVVDALWLTVGPLFYGYVRGLFPGRGGWEPEDAVHAVLPVSQWVVLAAFAWAPASDPALVEAGGPAVSFVFLALYTVQSAAYAVATLGLVGRYAARYRREAAGAGADRLVGLRRLAALFAVYAAAVAVNVGVLLATGGFWAWLDYLVPLALAALVAAVGYGLLRRPGGVFPDLALPPDPAPPPAEESHPREASPSPEMVRHADALRTLMETERPHLDPEVRLGDLAGRLGVSERTLSQVLAEAVGGSFYDVVNGYRVSEAQDRLADPAYAHFTVLAVGLDAGFSSKASFNRVFKARTGETPSAYRRRAAASPGAPSVGGDGVLVDVRPEAVRPR